MKRWRERLLRLRRQDKLHAKRLRRREGSSAEWLLWQGLKDCQLGVNFRREAVVAGVVVDFYCAAEKLVIEVDGILPLVAPKSGWDRVKEAWFKAVGLRVLRFSAWKVQHHTEVVLKEIAGQLQTVREVG